MRRLAGVAGTVAVALGAWPVASAQESPDTHQASARFTPRAFLEENCLECHNEEASTAMALFSGLYLDRVDVTDVGQEPVVWEEVVVKLRTGMMPPSSEPRPDPGQEREFLEYLESELDTAARANLNPGRPALHRLNRTEYANAIRELLALDVDAETLLPVDDASFGFDNIAGSLGVSPVLIERYAEAAGKISRLAIGDPALTPELAMHYVPNFLMQGEHIEGLPLGTRGGIRVEHFFPLDAEYVLTVDLMSAVNGIHIGNGVPNEQLEVTLDGERIALFDISKPPPAPPAAEEEEDAPEADTREPSEEDAPPAAENMEKEGEKWEVRVPVTAGPHVLTAAFIKKNHAPIEDIIQQSSNTLLDPLFNGTPEVTLIAHVGSLTVDGPYNATGPGDTPSRRKVFVCRPQQASQEEECARQILTTLASRAYRQPVGTEHVSVLMGFFEEGRTRGGFDKGVEVSLQRILASPQFIFRFERDPRRVDPDEAYRISDLELASRLAFFLWSSIPDDELLELATRDRLSRPAVLREQVERMLADPRSSALTQNFAGQWLYLRNLDIKDASTYLFPDFDDNLRNSFRRETELLFENVMREDRSILELLTADYTFVNERLAKHYGIEGIYGSRFRRVEIDDPRRQGILGHGSVLLVTSQPNRTSPVTRGVWVLENILGAHVPSPPPVPIPALEEAAGDTDFESLSVRELMELHRSKPFCEGCHKIMDPVGLAMENYDVIGRWRTHDGGAPIDASARLVDGTEIDGPVELRQALLKYSEQIVRNITDKLLTYAIGRGTEYYDAPVVRSIVRDAAAEDFSFSSIVMGIVTSEPFLMRAPESLADAAVAARE
jgi:Protein of unknown function (DUF1592)/Protein of unknown function (DUF1588)/Protein of unknown function (DUF1585)/Protein of unknown function (DUF1587)/Protein of unknown function (DUF1595)